jgi:hypothetical protein
VTERNPRRPKPTRETIRDGSRREAAFTGLFQGGKGVAAAITAVGLVAAALLLATEFSTVAKVDVANGSCQVLEDTNPDLADRCELSGFERNGGSFVLLALLTGAMAWGAGLGGSRPAGVALIGVGAVVLIWALFADLPETKDTGLIGQDFAGATASAGAGLYLEIVGGALAIAAGVVRLLARGYRGGRTEPAGPERSARGTPRAKTAGGTRPAARAKTGGAAKPRGGSKAGGATKKQAGEGTKADDSTARPDPPDGSSD